MSDTIRESVSGTGALKSERSLSVVFSFERQKSENPVIRYNDCLHEWEEVLSQNSGSSLVVLNCGCRLPD